MFNLYNRFTNQKEHITMSDIKSWLVGDGIDADPLHVLTSRGYVIHAIYFVQFKKAVDLAILDLEISDSS